MMSKLKEVRFNEKIKREWALQRGNFDLLTCEEARS